MLFHHRSALFMTSFMLFATISLAAAPPVAAMGTHSVTVTYQPGLGVSWTASADLTCSLGSVPAPEVEVSCTSDTYAACWNPEADADISGIDVALTVTTTCTTGVTATCTADTELQQASTSASCGKSEMAVGDALPFVCHVAPTSTGTFLGYKAVCQAIIW